MRTIQGHASLGLSGDAAQRLETCLQMQAWLPLFDYKVIYYAGAKPAGVIGLNTRGEPQ